MHTYMTIKKSNYPSGMALGDYYETDIKTALDGHEITAYNTGGITYIWAEQMRDFGYEVIWNENDRTLKITSPTRAGYKYDVFLSRGENTGDESFAKIYIRADNRKVAIKRKYQDFMEFYADISGLLLSIFWVLGVIFAYYDRIKANHSISKKLFYFEGIKDNKFAQFNKIKEIIYDKNKEKEKENILPYEGEKNIRSPIGFNNISSYSIRNSQNKNLEVNLSQRNTNAKMIKENKENNDEENAIDYSNYNLFEMLMSFDFCYCKTKKFENKVNLMGQARNIIDGKLDIVYYVRNMLLFDIINKKRPTL